MIEVNKYCQGDYQVDEKPFKFMREVNNITVTRDNGFKIYKEKSQSTVHGNFFGNRVANYLMYVHHECFISYILFDSLLFHSLVSLFE